MIIKAKHHFLLDPFFRFYVIRKMKKMFHSVKITGEFNDQNKPVLLIGNHISWWDGIWALNFNQQIIQRKFHFMMLEEQLRKNWFFKYTGGFSIQKKSKSIVETLSYTAELLSHPQNLVLLFPTGKIQSMHKDQFFEKGTEKILQKLQDSVHVIFMVNVIDYFSHPNHHFLLFTKNIKEPTPHWKYRKNSTDFTCKILTCINKRNNNDLYGRIYTDFYRIAIAGGNSKPAFSAILIPLH